jgi:hypothetical protein
MSKTYTPTEAAILVLKKAKELYKASSLSKAESKHDRCVKDVERNSPGVTNAHAVCVAEGVKPAKWNKSEIEKAEDPLTSVAGARIKRAAGYKEQGDTMGQKIAMEGAKDSHKDRLRGIKEAPKPNLGKSQEMPMKGHIKLAKFVGRMEAKREEKAKPKLPV